MIEDAIIENKKELTRRDNLPGNLAEDNPITVEYRDCIGNVVESQDTYSCQDNDVADVDDVVNDVVNDVNDVDDDVDVDEEKRCKLIRMFRDNDILTIYHAGEMQWSPHMDSGDAELSKLNQLYELLVNKNMWLLVFDKLCAGFLVEETALRRIDYFNEFIQNDMIMDKTDDEVKNFGAYMVLGEEPLGASMYIVRLDSEPYGFLLKNITASGVNTTLSVICDSEEITDATYSLLDKDFMSTFFGFTSETNLCVSFQKYLSEKGK
jgi:hypothetical protein